MTIHFENVGPLRRRIMSAVRGWDTKPEMAVSRLLHSVNYRYRLHRKGQRGRPEVVFATRRRAIFLHGCFWHRHKGCKKVTVPKTRAEFWNEKFERNVDRDREVEDRLSEIGWRTLIVWECETRRIEPLKKKLHEFLETEGKATTSKSRSAP